MSQYLLPRITAVSRPFWQACNESQLTLQHCTSPGCGRAIFYPRVCCPHCGGGDLEWRPSAGTGHVLTYTIVHRPHHESFYKDAPFVFAAVGLDEGVMMYTRIECEPEKFDGLIGQRVEVVFRDLSPSQKAPFFRLAQTGDVAKAP